MAASRILTPRGWRKTNRLCKSKIPLSKKPCLGCKEGFLPGRPWSKFCSKKCQVRYRGRHRIYEGVVKRILPDTNAPFGTLSCPICDKKIPSTRSPKKYCSHRCYRLRLQRNWQNKNRGMGLCYSCKQPPINGMASWCEKHWLAQAAWRAGLRGKESWRRIKQLLELQNYTCPYTGKKLVIGTNASIDHKLPRSKYPNLVGDIGNFEWVDEDVNRAKRTMTKDEFISLCKVVASRFK